VPGRAAACFSFRDLCDEALGAADFIHLAETFRVVYLSHVPVLTLANRNEMRRFINLIDALYEGRVRLVVLADALPPALLYLTVEEKAHCAFDEVFAFDRTVSRLLEMSSEAYAVERAHPLPMPTSALAGGTGGGTGSGTGAGAGGGAGASVHTSTYEYVATHITSPPTPTARSEALLALLSGRLPVPAAAVAQARVVVAGSDSGNDSGSGGDTVVKPATASRPASSRVVGAVGVLWRVYNWGRECDGEGGMPLPCLQVLLADLKDAKQHLLDNPTLATATATATAPSSTALPVYLSAVISRIEQLVATEAEAGQGVSFASFVNPWIFE
jgi:hypothetical protein